MGDEDDDDVRYNGDGERCGDDRDPAYTPDENGEYPIERPDGVVAAPDEEDIYLREQEEAYNRKAEQEELGLDDDGECGLGPEDDPTEWNPFSGKPPVPFAPRDPPPLDKRPDLREVFCAEYTELLDKMANVQANAKSIWEVTKAWRRYQQNTESWAYTKVIPPYPGQPHGGESPRISGMAVWHYEREIWETEAGRHFTQVRDSFRSTDPASADRARARKRKHIAAKRAEMTPAEKEERNAAERKRKADLVASDPDYKTKRAAAERARIAAKKAQQASSDTPAPPPEPESEQDKAIREILDTM